MEVPGKLCLRCLLGYGLKEGVEEGEKEMGSAVPGLGEPPRFTDRYRLIEKVGEGGCGIVYRAEQTEPVRREVAIKVIKLGMDTRAVTSRFEAERQALARMDHPGIARIYDAGATLECRPYFAMEFVPGERITTYCARKGLSIKERLDLFIELCHAVQHAHQKGVIHRDIKPSNVLVVEVNGKARPKVIDFGVAKATSRQRLRDETIYTAFDQFVGTPAYMSPEQAGAIGNEVDTRTDVYSLGVLLYELVTGRPPFAADRLQRATLAEVWRIIREEDPPRPSTFSRENREAPPGREGETRVRHWPVHRSPIPSDLDWIVLKALEKDPSRRYPSASDYAEDLQRHLNSEPVLACPPTRIYRLQKAIQRNKAACLAISGVFMALVFGITLSTWALFKEKEALASAIKAEGRANTEAARSEEVTRILKEMLAAAAPSVALGRDTTLLREILDKTAERLANNSRPVAEIEAELLPVLGTAYLDIRHFDKAEDHLRRALSVQSALHGETNEAVAATLTTLARLMDTRQGAGDDQEGEALARRGLGIRRFLFGERHLAVAETEGILAAILANAHRSSEAEGFYRQVLATYTNLAPQAAWAHIAKSALASLLAENPARLKEAEQLAREALDLQQKNGSENTPLHANALAALAMVLERAGRYEECTESASQAMIIRSNLFGRDSALLPPLIDLTSRALQGQGKWAEAEKAIRQGIEMQQRLEPDNQSSLAGSLLTLAGVLHNQKRHEEAAAAALRCVEIRRRLNGDVHFEIMHGLHWAGLAFLALGDYAEAEHALKECLKIVEDSSVEDWFAESQGLRYDIQAGLGEALVGQWKFSEAEPLLLRSYEGLIKYQTKWTYSNITGTLRKLIKVYENTGRPGEAAAWMQRLTDHEKGNSPVTQEKQKPADFSLFGRVIGTPRIEGQAGLRGCVNCTGKRRKRATSRATF